VPLVCQAAKDQSDQRETRELSEPLEHQVRLDPPAKLAPLDPPVHSDHLASPEPQENLACPVFPDLWDLWVTPDLQVIQDPRETLDPEGFREPLATPDHVV